MDPPFPKIKSKKEGGYQSTSQCSSNTQSDHSNYFKHYLFISGIYLLPTARYLPCVRRYGVAIAVAPNGQSPREGKGNTSETESGFWDTFTLQERLLTVCLGLQQVMYTCVGLQSICKNFCLKARWPSFEKLINKTLHNPTLTTLQRGFV